MNDLYDIINIPDPVLKQTASAVGGVSADIQKQMDRMLATMYAAPGIGLAAIQVGVPLNIIVMDLAREDDDPKPQYFINPEILEFAEEEKPYEEGCLSVPDVFDEVDRAERVQLRYLDYYGKLVTEWAEDLYAVCIQHEMDHLKGILFIDYLSRLKRGRAVKKVQKAEKLKAAG